MPASGPSGRKTIQIVGIDKPFEDFMVFTSEDETFYVDDKTLIEMFREKLTVRVEKKRTRTWIVSAKEYEPVEKKVDRFDIMKRVEKRKPKNGRKGQS